MMKKISGTKPLSEQVDTLAFEAREDGALPSGAAIWWISIIEVHWSLTPIEMGQNHHPLPQAR